jgi:ATP-dependent helicase/nuclease subunit B
MSIERVFLGFESPALESAGAFLLERFRRKHLLDMRNAMIVLPGRRPGRRLREILAEHAAEARLIPALPEIRTTGTLPEELYVSEHPFASELVQQLTWARVLHQADDVDRNAVVPAAPYGDDASDLAWLDMGALLRRYQLELAADGLTFADVARQGKEMDDFSESSRWAALARLQQEYLRLLEGWQLEDSQHARLQAIARSECRTDAHLVLVGIADISKALRQMLDGVVAQGTTQITVLIFAPDDWADRFDEYGGLIPEVWQELSIPLDEEQLEMVEGPDEQCGAVWQGLVDWSGELAPDEIAIGMPDERLVPRLQRYLDQADLPNRWATGRLLSETGPCRLLAAVAGFVQGGRREDLAGLLRHPDLFAWLKRRVEASEEGEGMKDWLTELDDYHQEHLQARYVGSWLGSPAKWEKLDWVQQELTSLVAPLSSGQRTLSAWTEPLLELLRTIYASNDFDSSDPLLVGACDQLVGILHQHTLVPDDLLATVTAPEAISLILTACRGKGIPPPADPDAIELLGWLELLLDDAPGLIVTSVNEGYVPSSINEDLFLPDRFRTRLGLEDNARRYARDAYVLSTLSSSRRRLRLVVARRDQESNPLPPSRLLFACDDQTAADRCLRLYSEAKSGSFSSTMASGSAIEPKGVTGFVVPRPKRVEPGLTGLRVTAFRAYLACKYRFYLEHVLSLAPLDDRADELDGAQFGTLVHQVLQYFGRSSCRTSTQVGEIRTFLQSSLERCVQSQFGNHSLPPVPMQMSQLERRLDRFAEIQAAWVADGWRIQHTEVAGKGELIVDGQPFEIRGRIDRVDVNENTGEWAILDYKSSDTAVTPNKAHQKGGEWIDLQLPLYRHLVGALDLGEDVVLGFVNLPADPEKMGFELADWGAEDLIAADEVAEGVVNGIRQQVFWPPTDPPPAYSERLATICQDGVFERGLPEEDESQRKEEL